MPTAKVRDRGIENEDAAGIAPAPSTGTPGSPGALPRSSASPPPASPSSSKASFGVIGTPRWDPTGEPGAAEAWAPATDGSTVGRPTASTPAIGGPTTGPVSGSPIAATVDPTAITVEEPAAGDGGGPSQGKALLIGAVSIVVVLLLGAVAAVALRGGEGDGTASSDGDEPAKVEPDALLAKGEASLVDTLGLFDAATTLGATENAAVQAKSAATALDEPIAQTKGIESPAARQATAKALTDERDVLAAFGGLSGYQGDNLTQWVLLSAKVQELNASLGTQLAELKRLEVYTPTQDLVAKVEATRAATGQTMQGIADKLAAWKVEADRVQADKDAQLQAVDSYASAVRSQTSRYSELRKETQRFVDKVDDIGATFEEAYDFLYDAGSQRSSIRSSLSSMSPPAAAASTHGELVSVLDTAIGAIDDAIDGTREVQDSWWYADCDFYEDTYEYYCYDGPLYYRDSYGWTTFSAKSDQITSSYDAALDRWESAVAGERNRINAIPLPPKPAV